MIKEERRRKKRRKNQCLEKRIRRYPFGISKYRLDTNSLPHSVRIETPAFLSKKRNMRYLRPFGIFNCRRARNRRRLACVLCIEFCRRPPGSRYAGHILYTTFSRYSSSYTHLVCTNKNDGALPTPYPHHLSE